MLRTCRRVLRKLARNRGVPLFVHRPSTRHFTRFQHQNASSTQVQWYNECESNSVAFWKEAAKAIEWSKFPETIFLPHDRTHQMGYSWLSDGELNITVNMMDRHVRDGHGDRTAIIYDSPLIHGDAIRHISFSELLELVENCSAYLVNKGVTKGDRVLIYMPMIPEALVAMYAAARIGAVHCGLFCIHFVPLFVTVH